MGGVAWILFLLVSFVWFAAAAADDELSVSEYAQLPPDEYPHTNRDASMGWIDQLMSSVPESREDRDTTKWMVLGSFGYFDMWVPAKVGLALVHNFSGADSAELMFDRGSVGFDRFGVSLGKASDDRFALVWRHYGPRNSFNYFVGLHHSTFRIKVRDDYLASVPAADRGGVNAIEMVMAGPVFGIGNRWQTRGGFVWSFDWLAVNLPWFELKSRTAILGAVTSPRDRQDIEDLLRAIRNTPTGAIFKVQLGYAF